MLIAPWRTHDGNFGHRVGEVHVRTGLFARHDDVGSAISFAKNERDFRHGGFDVGVNDFRSVADDAVVFLRTAGKEPGDVFQRDDRDIETVAKTDEPGRLVRCVDIEHPGQKCRLVGYDSRRTPPMRTKPITTFLAKCGMIS